MADAEKYAEWIVKNADKRGTPDFEKVAKAYRVAKSQETPDAPEINTDPTAGMSEWEKFRAGVGSSLARKVQGVKQRLGMASEQEVAETRERDRPLLEGGSEQLPPIQTGRYGVRDVPRPARTSRGAGGMGQLVGDVVPLAALSTLLPGANTVLGSAGLGAASGVTEPTAPGESVLENTLMGGAVGGGAAAAVKGAGMAARAAFDRSQTQGAAAASRNAVKDQTLAQARAEGYVVPPSAEGSGFVAKGIESLSGKAAMGQKASEINQQVTNRIARREAGLADDAPISVDTLKAARDQMSAPYREVAAVSPRADSALKRLQESRIDASDNWKKYFRDGDPKFRKEAMRLDSENRMLESVIDKEAQRVGKPDLVSQLREARRALAKNHDVEKAINVGGGDVDAEIIGRMLDKGRPLSGGLETIGRFAERFGKYAKEPSKTSTAGGSALTSVASTLFGLGGYHAAGPEGISLAALPLLGGPARAVALSKLMQRPNQYGPGTALRLSDIAANSELAKRALPASTVGVVNTE